METTRDPRAKALDPELKRFATPREAEYIDAVNKHGGLTKASAALGVSRQVLQRAVANVERKAAREGWAPGNWQAGVAPGYLMGKVTVQRDEAGAVVQTWERQSPDRDQWQMVLDAAAEAMREEMPRLDPIERPLASSVHALLCNLYPYTDYHLGMAAWAQEGGAEWDLDIAERLLIDAFERMVMAAPRAHTAVIWQGGDFLHFDSLLPVTPKSRHVLDAAARMRLIIKVAVRVLRRLIDIALMRHEHVHVIMGEGNHDETSSAWLQTLLAALYENEPRVSVDDSQTPFYAFEWGRTMLAFHHGHQMKPDQLPLLFAARHAEMWGRTTKRYANVGHWHHLYEKEHAGMKVKQHPTLAAASSYDARKGYNSEREITADTFHKEFGRIGYTTVTPEMIAAGAAA